MMEQEIEEELQMFIDVINAVPDNSVWNILYTYHPEDLETLEQYLVAKSGYKDQSMGEPDFCFIINKDSRKAIVDLSIVCHQSITFNNKELFLSYDHLLCNWVAKTIFAKMNNADKYLKSQVFEMMDE